MLTAPYNKKLLFLSDIISSQGYGSAPAHGFVRAFQECVGAKFYNLKSLGIFPGFVSNITTTYAFKYFAYITIHVGRDDLVRK